MAKITIKYQQDETTAVVTLNDKHFECKVIANKYNDAEMLVNIEPLHGYLYNIDGVSAREKKWVAFPKGTTDDTLYETVSFGKISLGQFFDKLNQEDAITVFKIYLKAFPNDANALASVPKNIIDLAK